MEDQKRFFSKYEKERQLDYFISELEILLEEAKKANLNKIVSKYHRALSYLYEYKRMLLALDTGSKLKDKYLKQFLENNKTAIIHEYCKKFDLPELKEYEKDALIGWDEEEIVMDVREGDETCSKKICRVKGTGDQYMEYLKSQEPKLENEPRLDLPDDEEIKIEKRGSKKDWGKLTAIQKNKKSRREELAKKFAKSKDDDMENI